MVSTNQPDRRRVVILDDDPTGTQTVSGVSVILRPSLEAYRQFFAGEEKAVYVLTNSRAMPREEAVALVSRIKREVEQAAEEAGLAAAFLLRGDSTLRGHVFAEIDVFADREDSVSLFVPAFPEGGRVTMGGVHYLEVDGTRTPVNRTEFAKDTTFGYTSERIADYIAEVGQGRPAVIVPLKRLRTDGAAAVEQALLTAPARACVVPEAETRADLELAAHGLLAAEARGRHVAVRTASTFAAIRAGLRGASLPGISPAPRRVLAVCGSHTAASTRQLAELAAVTAAPIVIPTDRLLAEGTAAIVEELGGLLLRQLEESHFAILSSERVRQEKHGDLAAGAKVMDAIIGLVALAAPACDGVIAKGGITSAQVATDGLQAAAAFVKGQLEPGVSLWEIGLPDGRRIPYAVIPGNVGHDLTMTEVAAKFGVHMRSGSAQAGKTPDSKIPHTSKSSHSMEGIRSKPEPESGSDTEGDRRSFQLTPIKKESIVAIVTRQLMSFLLSGAVRPGERIPAERQLAETLGVGRSTLRESLKVLTVLGLLEARLGDGTYLKKADSELLPGVIEWGLLLGEKSTKDLIEARQKIEVIIASLAAERRSAEQLAELRSFLKVMEQEGSGESRFVEADIAFHMKLADMADNSALRDMLRSVQALLRTWITSVIQSPGSIQATYEEHSRIYEAVERGDAREAEEAMDLHMKSATLRLLKAQADAGIL